MPQIGEISFAGRGREYTLLQICFGRDSFEHSRKPDACEQPGIGAQLTGKFRDDVVAILVQFLGGAPENW